MEQQGEWHGLFLKRWGNRSLAFSFFCMSSKQPIRLGLALSGAAARSAFYLGFIEVLQEEHIPVSVIAAQSGASLVAASFACGTLPKLKKEMLGLNWQKVRGLLTRSKRGGLYSLELAEEYFRTHLTRGLKFGDLETKLCFAASNIETGKLVPLAMGDVAHSMRITCTVPGLFEPVQWGNQVLVDGGLLSVIPAQLARQTGADVVIGVSVRSTKHIFLPSHIRFWRVYRFLKHHIYTGPRGWIARYLRRSVSPEGLEAYVVGYTDEEERPMHSVVGVLARSLELATNASRAEELDGDDELCDLVVREGVGKYGDSVNISKAETLYNDGRRSALEHLPAIRALLNSAAER
jgi:predicted acylesterase/phospholipase RssA